MASERQFHVASDEQLLTYLLTVLGSNRTAIKKLLKYGAVQVNGRTLRRFNHQLAAGDEVVIRDLRTAAIASKFAKTRIAVVYEDDELIVVDKPAGLLTVATETKSANTLHRQLNQFLRQRERATRYPALVVHRLDRETSGLVLFARSQLARQLLQESWPSVEKNYYAVVEGCPHPAVGTLKSFLIEDPKSLKVFSTAQPVKNARLAITEYRVLQAGVNRSLLVVRLKTGRKHQIRVQLADLGHPIVGDQRYGKRRNARQRLALHAGGLHFLHPVTNAPVRLSSPLPRELKSLLR